MQLECTRELRHPEGSVLCVRFNNTANYCVSGGSDRRLRLWNTHTGASVAEFKGGHGYDVLTVAVSGDSTRLVSGGGDAHVVEWDVRRQAAVRRLRGHGHGVNSAVFHCNDTENGSGDSGGGSGDGSAVVVTGGRDRCVLVFDCRSRSPDPMQRICDATDAITSVRCWGARIVTGSVDGHVRAYDVRMGRRIDDAIGPPIGAVGVTADGACTLVATLDSTVRLFDAVDGQLLATYRGHENTRSTVEARLMAHDAFVVGGSEDGSVHLWDLVSAEPVAVLRGHSACVTTVHSHDARPGALLTGSLDGSVRLWEVPKKAKTRKAKNTKTKT